MRARSARGGRAAIPRAAPGIDRTFRPYFERDDAPPQLRAGREAPPRPRDRPRLPPLNRSSIIESSEIDGARLLSEVRILLRLFQQFVELPIEQVPLVLLGGKRLLESLLAPSRRPLQFRNLRGEVLDHRLLLGFGV